MSRIQFIYPILASTLRDAREIAHCGAALAESEPTEQVIAHSRWAGEVNGVEIWFCYGAGHYYFVQPEEQTA